LLGDASWIPMARTRHHLTSTTFWRSTPNYLQLVRTNTSSASCNPSHKVVLLPL
jgi:hypothetical protein